MNKIKSREKFVDQVANTIRSNHGKNNESFIFGISGKWGEGKTEFLNSLEKKLNLKFEIVNINPWKFATDKISFLRYFVTNLPSSKINLLKRIRVFINRENTRDKIYYDFSENVIHGGWFLFILLTIIWIFVMQIGYSGFLEFSTDSNFKWIFAILLLPIILSLVGKMVSSQKGSKSIETLDKFDKYLDDKLNNYNGKDILVFVDDLDRVSPKIARDVLDNLRTFFDKEKLSFVVTGDHTVLERFLGKELLPGSNESEQLDEGKRFLKKIFNVYWRLPLPIDSEINKFLDELFKENKVDLDDIFNNRSRARTVLKGYLSKYFDKNFRHIIRFFDSIIFTFNIIKNLNNNNDKGNKDEISQYYIELSNNPLLVIRILIIQELCAPLFEEIIKDFEILSNLEYAVDKQNSQEIKSILDKIPNQLTSTQRQFIEKFLFEKPRFYRDTLLRVSDIRPFLHLAADAGFGDSRGPSADDFTIILNSEDPKQIRQAFLASGKKKLEDGVKKFISDFTSNEDINKKNTLIKSIINALLEILEYKDINNIFFENLISLDFSYLKQLQSLERIETYKIIWKWLNNFIDKKNIGKYKELFKFDSQEDFRNINFEEDKKADYFSSLIIAQWFISHYNQDKSDALVLFNDKLKYLDDNAVIDGIKKVKEELLNELIIENNENLRNIRFDIVWKYSDSKIQQLLKDKLSKEILKLNNNIWSFVVLKSGELKEWVVEDFEMLIVEAVKNVSDFNFLTQVFNFAKSKINTKLVSFWDTILENHFKLFMDNIGQIIDDVSYSVLAPNNDNAEKIFNELLDRIKNFDDGSKINVLPFLNKQKWLWNKLHKIDNRRLSGLLKNKNIDIKSIANQVKDSWEDENV